MSNLDAAALDADDILRTADVTLTHLKGTSIGQNKCVELLEELYQHTKQLLEAQVDIEKIEFAATELADWVSPQADSETASKFVRRHLSNYEEFVRTHQEEIDKTLRASGCPGRLVVAKKESKGRHRAYYYLSLDTLDSDNTAPDTSQAASIRYRVRKFKRPLPWSRVFLSIDLAGKGLWVPLVLICVSFVALWFAFTRAVLSGSAVQIVIVGMFCAVWITIARPLWRVLDSGVAMAPEWLYGLDTQAAQFEIHETDSLLPSGRKLKQLRLVVYEGECLVCGASVSVFPGKGRHRGRQIGRCSRAAAEHIYTFDHITKVGFPLDQTADYQRVAAQRSPPKSRQEPVV